MDQGVRTSVPQIEGVPGQSTSVVQARTRYSTSSVLRSYRASDQFGPGAKAEPSAETNLLC